MKKLLVLTFGTASVSSQKCDINDGYSDFGYLNRIDEQLFDARASSESGLTSYAFQFQMLASENDKSRSDYEIHAILDFESETRNLESDLSQNAVHNMIDMVMKPNGDDLDLSLVINSWYHPKIFSPVILTIPQFWDQLLSLEFKITDLGGIREAIEPTRLLASSDYEPQHFKIFLNGSELYSSEDHYTSYSQDKTDDLHWSGEDLTAINSLVQNPDYSDDFRYRPRYALLKENWTFKTIGDQPSDDVIALKVVDTSSKWESYASTGVSVNENEIKIYDNILNKAPSDFNTILINEERPIFGQEGLWPIDVLKITRSDPTSFSLEFTGKITNSIFDKLSSNPLRFPLSDLVSQHTLVLSLSPILSGAPDLEFPLSIYLQNSQAPFEVLSNQNKIFVQADDNSQ